MKHFFMTLGVVLAASLTMTSCLSSDDSETIYYEDMAVTGVTLGTLNRYTYTTSSRTGNDTIIKSSLTGSAYAMAIDHLNCQIYNNTPLPIGTDLAHVLISSITTKNSGVATLKSLISDSVMFISSTDSIDFSVPRTLRVYNNSLSQYRDYTMTLYTSVDAGITFSWRLLKTDPLLQGWTNCRLVNHEDTVRLVPSGVVTKGNKAYRVNGSNVEWSADLEQWNIVGPADLSVLLGAGTDQLFALGKDMLMKHSADDGLTWLDEELDEVAALLPVSHTAMTAWDYAPVDSTDYVLMAGQTADNTVSVWRKLNHYGATGKGGRWVYMPVDQNNRYALPRLDNLNLTCYNSSVLALGSDMTIYQSDDQGITWKQSTAYVLPLSITGTEVAMTADKKGNLWLVTNTGEVWQGAKR